jgi:hypothetical protein
MTNKVNWPAVQHFIKTHLDQNQKEEHTYVQNSDLAVFNMELVVGIRAHLVPRKFRTLRHPHYCSSIH